MTAAKSLRTRASSASAAASAGGGTGKLKAPPMTYIAGEEMTRYCMQLVLDKLITPHVDTSAWEFYDLSCKSRDDTEDQVLHDAVASGARIGAIFKEPTVTPTEVQKELLGLKKAWGSPNGAMRRGWNGITISRDTIHIEGMELGFKRPVLFERQAVGGEYSAGYDMVGEGTVRTVFTPKGSEQGGPDDYIVDERELGRHDTRLCFSVCLSSLSGERHKRGGGSGWRLPRGQRAPPVWWCAPAALLV